MTARVAVFLPDLGGGGAERAMLAIAASFAERCQVDLVLAGAGGALAHEVDESVEVVELRASRVIFAIPALARHLRRSQPDAVISALTHANVVAILARALSRTRPKLIVVEQSHLSVATAGARRLRDRVLPLILRVLYPTADAVSGVSMGVADDLAREIKMSRSDVLAIPNPIPAVQLRARAAGPPSHPWLAERDEGPVAVAVGRLTAQKDFPTLLRAVVACRREVPLRLVIFGEGEDRAALEADIVELGLTGSVSLAGFRPNPFPDVRAADVFVLSSRWEGLPTVLIEAMAVGTKVVATDCPSGPFEILRGGELGHLVPVGDAEALARAILATLADDAPPDSGSVDRYAPSAVRAAYAEALGLRIDE